MALQMIPDILQHGRKVPDDGVGMHIEDIRIIAGSVEQHDVIVIQQRSARISAGSDGQLRVAGLESEVGRFQRGGIIPGAFGANPMSGSFQNSQTVIFPLNSRASFRAKR